MAILNDIVQTRAVCQLGDQASINVRHWQVTDVQGTGQTNQQIATSLSNTFAGVYQAVLSIQAIFRGIGVQVISPAPPSIEAVPVFAPVLGTVGGDAMPRQVSGVIALKSDIAGKSYSGRTYAPFPGEGDSDQLGIPTPAYVVRLGNLADTYANVLIVGVGGNTVSLTPVIYSKKLTITTPVASYVARAKWGTQRRRGSFGRPNPPPF